MRLSLATTILATVALLQYTTVRIEAKKTFITDVCASDDDCASGCCGFNTGKCAGAIVAQQRDGGCGFGNAAPNANAAKALGSSIAAPGVAKEGGNANNKKATGKKKKGGKKKNGGLRTAAPAAATSTPNKKKTFITDVCQSDNDCESGCCGFNTGKCAGAIIAQQRDGGCGFGNAVPNADAAKALGSSIAAPGVAQANNQATAADANSNNLRAAVSQKKKTFITDVCQSDNDCESGCCGFNTGKCAGPIIAQQRDGGCGFGNAVPNADAAKALGSSIAAPGVPRDNANSQTSNKGNNNNNASTGQKKKTFITDVCKSDDDCASGCCGFNSGKCAGAIIAQQRDGGCGFGNPFPNADAAKALGSSIAAPGVLKTGGNAQASTGTNNGNANNNNASAGQKKKTFITDVCKSDDDCASGCCGFNTGKCAGPVIAQQRDGGCGFGNAVPNANAAKALGSNIAAPGVPKL